MNSTEHLYKSLGAQFITPVSEIEKKLAKAKAFVFDWDGVFNNGFKLGQNGSGFNEVDSMGTNLLRFSYFLKNGTLPLAAVISGEKNESAQFYSSREHFDFAFYKIANKIDALNFICEHRNISPDEVVYFFDDVLDLSIAKVCGVRILVSKNATALFSEYCIKNKLVDYITANDGGNYAVRESCEMLMSLNKNFDDVIGLRTEYTDVYKKYIGLRNEVPTIVYSRDSEGNFIKS